MLKSRLSIFLILFLISTSTLSAQDVYRFYLNSKKVYTTDSTQAKYIRVVRNLNNNNSWEVLDLYMSGKKQMRGYFEIDKKTKVQIKQGKYIQYYENGNIKNVCFYKDGLNIGKEIGYYESGKIDSEIIYDEKGRIIDEKYFKEDGSISVFQKPEFKGGQRAMYNFMGAEAQYPELLQKNNIEGKVYLKFKVCEDGTLCDFEILESPHEAFSDEAIRVLKQMPPWTPGTVDGRKVSVYFTMPFNFSLN